MATNPLPCGEISRAAFIGMIIISCYILYEHSHSHAKKESCNLKYWVGTGGGLPSLTPLPLVVYYTDKHIYISVMGSNTSTNLKYISKYMKVHGYSKVVYIKGSANVEFNNFNRDIFIVRLLIATHTHLNIISCVGWHAASRTMEGLILCAIWLVLPWTVACYSCIWGSLRLVPNYRIIGCMH